MTEHDESLETDALDISMGEQHTPSSTPIPRADEPSVPRPGPKSPWDEDQPGSSLTGHFDAWLAEVIEAPWTGNPHVQGVAVDRCDIEWLSNNEPNAVAVAPVESQNTPSRRIALPYVPLHDQEKYHVQAGDIVTVATGRDGRAYYFWDDKPFVAWVIDSTSTSVGTTEKHAGGAGNETITVRRYGLSEDPDSTDYDDHGTTLTDLQDASSNYIEYGGVRVISPEGTHHGYRLADMVLVTRRGRYMVAEPCREQFVATIEEEGPSGEDDFTDNRYWVREQDGIASYSGNLYTLALTDRARNVTGQSGYAGRWVCAYNYGEESTEHEIEAGETVVVSLFASAVSTREPFYVFSRTTPAGEDGGKSAIELLGGQYRALFCTEAPEWRFQDHIRVAFVGRTMRVPIDPLFIQACILNTIEPISLLPHRLPKGLLAARVENFHLVVESTEREQPAVPIVVTLSGLARGFNGRFPKRSPEQAASNKRFWGQACRGG